MNRRANPMILGKLTLLAVCVYTLLGEPVNTLHRMLETLDDADDAHRFLGTASSIPKQKGGHRYIALCVYLHQDLGCLVS